MEIKILKTRHYGLGQARKLRPYIEGCSVYAREAAGATERHVSSLEDGWRAILKNPRYSRTLLRKQVSEDPSLKNAGELVKEYAVEEMDYLFRNRKPLWHVERFSDEEAGRLNELCDKKDKAFAESKAKLYNGDIEAYLRFAKIAIELRAEDARIRDGHIRGILSDPNTESRIRDAYRGFPIGENLNFVVSLGAGHRPEEGMLTQPLEERLYPEPDFPLFELVQSGTLDFNDPEFKRQAVGAGIITLLGKKASTWVINEIKTYSLNEMGRFLASVRGR